MRQHLVAIASKTKSGIDARWWIEKLVEMRELEGFTSGPAFGNSDLKASRLAVFTITRFIVTLCSTVTFIHICY